MILSRRSMLGLVGTASLAVILPKGDKSEKSGSINDYEVCCDNNIYSPDSIDKINVRYIISKIADEWNYLIDSHAWVWDTEKASYVKIDYDTYRSIFSGYMSDYLRRLNIDGIIYQYDVICDSRNNPPDLVDSNNYNLKLLIQFSSNWTDWIEMNFSYSVSNLSNEESSDVEDLVSDEGSKLPIAIG